MEFKLQLLVTSSDIQRCLKRDNLIKQNDSFFVKDNIITVDVPKIQLISFLLKLRTNGSSMYRYNKSVETFLDIDLYSQFLHMIRSGIGISSLPISEFKRNCLADAVNFANKNGLNLNVILNTKHDTIFHKMIKHGNLDLFKQNSNRLESKLTLTYDMLSSLLSTQSEMDDIINILESDELRINPLLDDLGSGGLDLRLIEKLNIKNLIPYWLDLSDTCPTSLILKLSHSKPLIKILVPFIDLETICSRQKLQLLTILLEIRDTDNIKKLKPTDSMIYDALIRSEDMTNSRGRSTIQYSILWVLENYTDNDKILHLFRLFLPLLSRRFNTDLALSCLLLFEKKGVSIYENQVINKRLYNIAALSLKEDKFKGIKKKWIENVDISSLYDTVHGKYGIMNKLLAWKQEHLYYKLLYSDKTKPYDKILKNSGYQKETLIKLDQSLEATTGITNKKIIKLIKANLIDENDDLNTPLINILVFFKHYIEVQDDQLLMPLIRDYNYSGLSLDADKLLKLGHFFNRYNKKTVISFFTSSLKELSFSDYIDDVYSMIIEMETASRFSSPRLKNIQVLHDDLSSEIQLINQPKYALDQDIDWNNKRWDNYTINVPQTNHDLIIAGQALNICVGMSEYSERVKSGNIFIVLLYSNNKIKGCVELSHDLKIIQAKGKFNQNLDILKLSNTIPE